MRCARRSRRSRSPNRKSPTLEPARFDARRVAWFAPWRCRWRSIWLPVRRPSRRCSGATRPTASSRCATFATPKTSSRYRRATGCWSARWRKRAASRPAASPRISPAAAGSKCCFRLERSTTCAIGAIRIAAPPSIEQFAPHGIDIERRADGAEELLVVNHGGRESVEYLAGRTQRRGVGVALAGLRGGARSRVFQRRGGAPRRRLLGHRHDAEEPPAVGHADRRTVRRRHRQGVPLCAARADFRSNPAARCRFPTESRRGRTRMFSTSRASSATRCAGSI